MQPTNTFAKANKFREKASRLTHGRAGLFFMANAIFSLSTFLVNLSLPKILDQQIFQAFIYIFQMVLLMTSVTQIGVVVGLYHYIKQHREDSLNTYYSVILFINFLLLIAALFPNNFILDLLNVSNLNKVENLTFFLSIIVSGIFLYNKGKNIAEQDYQYMFTISIWVMALRIIALCVIHIFQISSLWALLFLLFICPFVLDIKDYIINSFRYIRISSLNKNILFKFISYSIKIWIISTLFNVSDRIFLISTKDVDENLTTAIAFSSGFVGIISLFNSCFTNFFISRLSSTKIEELQRHTKLLVKIAPSYFALLLLCCLSLSMGVFVFYSELGSTCAIVAFIILFRTGGLCYLGMFSLLTKVLNILNLEIVFNIARIAIVSCLCFYWHPENHLVWFIVVTFSIPIPEVLLTGIVQHRIKETHEQ